MVVEQGKKGIYSMLHSPKDTLGPAIFVLNREVSSSRRLKIH